jgi:hypothetical protein
MKQNPTGSRADALTCSMKARAGSCTSFSSARQADRLCDWSCSQAQRREHGEHVQQPVASFNLQREEGKVHRHNSTKTGCNTPGWTALC